MVHQNDFSGIWSGPATVLAGVSPWDPVRYDAAALALGTKTPDALVDDYMPWEVVALLPLGLLPLEVAAWIWMIASMALSTIALRALLRSFVPARPLVHGALGLALFVGQPGFHAVVLGQWALLLMSALGAVVLMVRAGHARRAAFAALAFLAKPQLFVWTAIGLLIPAFTDERYRRFIRYALVVAGTLIICAWLAFPDWFPAWLADIPPRRTGRSAVLLSALGELFGPTGRVLAVVIVAGGILLASRFVVGSDAWLAIWLPLARAVGRPSAGLRSRNGIRRSPAGVVAWTSLSVAPAGVSKRTSARSARASRASSASPASMRTTEPASHAAAPATSASVRVMSPAESDSPSARRQPRFVSAPPITDPRVSSSVPQTYSPSRARISRSTRATFASAADAAPALSAMRTCTPSFFA